MIVNAIQAAAHAVGVPFKLLLAICFIESGLNPVAMNGTSYGLCQIKFGTATHMGFTGTKQQLLDPHTNAFFAARYLQYQIIRYKGDIQLATAAYNTGTARLDDKGSLVNSWYVQRVFDYMVGINGQQGSRQ